MKGSKITFSACQDNLGLWRDLLSHGKSTEDVPLHNCSCPPCFTGQTRTGKLICEPFCELNQCDLDSGICHVPGDSSSGIGPAAVAGIVLLAIGLTALAGFGAYKVWLRGQMQAEIRAIMAQYMPLADVDVEGKELGIRRAGNVA